jgi:glyceraldehyde 3-phosphate dehydrogenase (phosphorylating)
MPVRVGINGFGRIGRNVFRAAMAAGADIDWVAVNDLTDARTLAHLLRYDSILGRYPGTVEVDGEGLIVDGSPLRVLAERDPGALPWGDLGVDVVIESTGFFTARAAAAKHLEGGASKVVISAPASGEDITVVLGVNFDRYSPAEHHVISNASCTTNCLAPMAKVLHERFGILRGYMVTIHAYTGDQNTVDTLHKDLHRARAAAVSAIPTSTGAARAVGLVLPELKGKLDGTAIRIPTPNVSLVSLDVNVTKPVTKDVINAAMQDAAKGELAGILDYNKAPLVSIDFNHSAASCTFDATQTAVVDGVLARVMGWYDNEWGFSNRMSDTAALFGSL